MSSIDAFVAKFKFVPKNAFKVGVERECFIRSMKTHAYLPFAGKIMPLLQQGSMSHLYGPELSACQVEFRTDPNCVIAVMAQMVLLENFLQEVLLSQGLYADFQELAPESLPLDVYPDERYLEISQRLLPDVLAAACRVAGTHVHIGMPDLETAIRVYNHVIKQTDSLIRIGDNSNGGRIRLYRTMAKWARPQQIKSVSHLHVMAREQGFEHNPRDWWSLIRITIHGTIEFRMFGNTDDVDRLNEWLLVCKRLCSEGIKQFHVGDNRLMCDTWAW